MDWRKALIAVFVLLVLFSSSVAYEGSGESNSNGPTACTDGSDNDGDGMVDANDVGCVKPYSADDSEGDVYDLDASWVFAGQQTPQDSGPSAFFGGYVERTDTSDRTDDSLVSSDTVNEKYVNESETAWGAGIMQDVDLQASNGGNTNTMTDAGGYELIDTPGTDTSDDCGDGIQQGDETTTSCPEDSGLPDDEGLSTDTASDILGSVTKNGYTDSVEYDPGDTSNPFLIEEYHTEDQSGNTATVSEKTTTSDTTRTINAKTVQNLPDFYLNSDNEIYAQYATKSNTEIGTVTNYYLETEYKDSYTSAGTAYTTCTSDSNSSCTGSSSRCTSRGSASQVTNHELKDDPDPPVISSSESHTHTTSESGSSGISTNSESKTLSLEVERKIEDEDASTEKDYYGSCGNSQSTWLSSDSYCNDDNGDGSTSCSLSGSTTYYTLSTDEVSYEDIESADITYQFEDFTLQTELVQDTDNSVSGNEMDSRDVLFDGDTFKGSSYQSSNIPFLSQGGRSYYSYRISTDNKDQGNDEAVSLSLFDFDVDSSDQFISVRESYTVHDADGQNGQGDGFIAISEGSIVGSTNGFLNSELTDGSSGSFVSNSDVAGLVSGGTECPSGYIKCVGSVDVSLKNLNNWSSTDPNSGLEMSYANGPHELDTSLGVHMLYQYLYDDPTTDGVYDSDPSPGDNRSCGDEPNEYWAYMEGPEVDESTMSDYPAHYEGCVSKTGPQNHFQCVYNGEPVGEGTMRNVADDNNRGYEAGQNNVDLEVCLDIPNEGDDVSGDNPNGNDYGGEWYDLDDPAVQEYMRSGNPGNYLVGADTTNTSHISYYWQTNPGKNSVYNPEGGNSGTALEDDCQTTINCGDNRDSLQTGSGLYYSWFEEGKRDEDYHPQGENTGSGILEGYMNRMHDLSNQLEPGMDTSTYNMMDPSSSLSGGITWERDSNGGASSADTWAITEDLQSVLSNEGVPYNPFSTYYESGATVRTQPSDNGIPKQTKVFGNSYAAVASSGLDGSNDDNGVAIDSGDGIWIDPDSLKQRVQNDDIRLAPSASSWTDMLRFQMDISGPDSGLGYDDGDGSSLMVTGPNNGIVWGDIYFEGEQDNVDNDGDGSIDESGETHTRLEKYMCGDDRYEYLVEEMGESNNPEQYDGAYACASRKDMCVDRSASGSPLFEEGAYRQTDEPGETDGRLKNDREVCTSISGTSGYIWFDQDYGDLDGDGTQDTCRQNNLYGSQGIRWFNQNYVNTYPDAVSGGIDDDWNAYLTQKGYSTVSSSVPNGVTYNDYKATVGFCGGDDEGEHVITQECNPRNNLCSTKRRVMGVAENPQKCVFDGSISQYSPVDPSKEDRLLYSPGDTITLDLAQPQTIACFNGVWYEKWPVTFTQNTVDVPLGEEARVPFRVINVRDEKTTFEVSLEEGSEVYRFSKFVEKDGDSFETVVPAQSSETFNVEVKGTDLGIDHSDDNLVVYAEALNADVDGEDSLSVDVVNNTAVNGTVKVGQPKSVPGVTGIQIAVLFMISSIVIWLQS